MDQQDVCILLGLNRAKQEVRRAARQLTSTNEVIERWGQSLKPVDAKWIKAALSWQENANQGVIGYFDSRYPALLRQIDEPPWLLFYQGRPELLHYESIAIVGSRKATHSGLQMSDWLATDCATSGIAVVSGLAMGIDSQVHASALESGSTVAVLGTGIDQIYPPRNRQLHRLIAHQGVLISEFPPGIAARMDHFPRRNRIISGLSQGVVVVEAARKSGSISTALAALNQGRHVGAVPGSVFNQAYDGCHWLIKEGAELICTPTDVLNWFAANGRSDRAITSHEPDLDESLANDKLFANVGLEVTTVDELIARSGLSAAKVTEQLLLLELQGAVKAVPGGYIKVGRR